jgi:pimeloyl-ACP methyl ester carboxylesterase/predicted N-acetyltransferase YhbS
VVPLVAADAGTVVVVPDLRGFGESESDTRPAGSANAYAGPAQAESVLGLMRELGVSPARPAVVAGYDIGSRIAQQMARVAPELVRALVIAPPLPGVGSRVLSEGAVAEFWYQSFHRLELAERLLDGNPAAVRAYLEHFWTHWSGPGYTPEAEQLDRLAEAYGAPGAFTASIGWYRAGSGTVARSLAEQAPAPEDRISVPTTVLWPAHDPLFPVQWADRIDAFFSAATLRRLPDAGHFAPLEAPAEFAAAIGAALRPARLMVEPVRRAGAADADVVARLLRDFNAEYDDPAPPQNEMANRIRALLGHGDTVILVAGEPPCAVSVVRFRPGLWSVKLESYLAELYVVPGRRGEGIGRALMQESMAVARAEGADTMELGTGEDDIAARRLYESLGFTNREHGPDGVETLSLFYEREL